MYKKILFLVFTFITGFSCLTACSSDDEEENNGVIQTDSDKAFENRLKGTTWLLVKKINYDSAGNTIKETNYSENPTTYYLSPEKAPSALREFDHLCIIKDANGKYEDAWRIYADGLLFIEIINGKIISLTDKELIISTYKQTILGDYHEDGYTVFFERAD